MVLLESSGSDLSFLIRAADQVIGGGHPPPIPTERSVRISRTTLFSH